MAEQTTTETPEGTGAQPSGNGATPPGGADFEARIRSDPAFALEQVKLHQGRADKLQSAEEKYQKLVEKIGERAMPLLEQYGGDVLAAATQNYAALRNADQTRELIQQLEQTGQLPPTSRAGSERTSDADDDDEYLTDEMKEIRSLREEIKTLKGQTNQQFTRSGQQAVEQHMRAVVQEFGFDNATTERMRKTLLSQVEQWQKQGDAGMNALSQILSPAGGKMVRAIMLGDLSPDDFAKAAQNRDLRKKQGLSSLATDGPDEIGSTGREPPPQFKNAVEAIQWARVHENEHDSY